MRNLNDHLLEKICKILIDIGVNEKTADDFELYLEDEIKEKDYLNSLPSIASDKIDYNEFQKIANTYFSLDKYKDKPYQKKFLKTLVRLNPPRIIEILRSFRGYAIYDECLKYDIEPQYIIQAHAKISVGNQYYLNLETMHQFDKLYDKFPNDFVQAFKSVEINEKLIIAAYLIHRNDKKYEEYTKWISAVIKNTLISMFESVGIAKDDGDLAAVLLAFNITKERSILGAIKSKFNNHHDNEEELARIISKKMMRNEFDEYLLRIMILISYMTLKSSEVSSGTIRLLYMIRPMKCIDNFADLRGHEIYTNINSEIKQSIKVMEDIINDLKLPQIYYISWLTRHCLDGERKYEPTLRSKIKENRAEVEEALKICKDDEYVYLGSILYKDETSPEFRNEAEEKYLLSVEDFMDSLNIPRNINSQFIEYLKGNLDFEAIRDLLKNMTVNQNIYSYYEKLKHMKTLYDIRKYSSIFKRNIRLYAYIRSNDIISNLFRYFKVANHDKPSMEEFVELLKECEVELDAIIPFLGIYVFSYYNENEKAKAILNSAIVNSTEEVIKDIRRCSPEVRIYLIESIFNMDREKYKALLTEYLEDTSKVVRERIVELLATLEDAYELILPFTTAKKQQIRESAVRVLLGLKDERVKEALREIYEDEKSEKIRSIISDSLNVSEEVSADVSILEFCKKNLKGNKKASIAWLTPDSLPRVRMSEDDEYADEDILKFILVSYSSRNEMAVNHEADRIVKHLNKEDMAEVVLEVLNRWLSLGAEAKKKWAMGFAGIYGDSRVVLTLKKQIEEWPQNSRGAIACDGVAALALNGSTEALLIVDSISRKFKFKQVKEAAGSALTFAAEELGIDKEELSDKIVPTLGFNERGEKVFDYGERVFIARLTTELSLDIYDEKDKRVKSLPAPGKRDDEEKSKKAYEEYKSLKKMLKTTSTIQRLRLEMALSSNRKWTKDAWTKLFVENPIMHQFAIGLLWGTYENDKLKDTFRYMEDGTFNTVDEEEYDLVDGSSIGLVHPIEITEEEKNAWLEQLENYEITQPFDQLTRKLYKITPEEKNMKSIERFAGITINGLSLLGKLTTFGWYKGSVQDAGCYYDFYREEKNLGIGANISFSGLPVGYENEETTILILNFYKAGAIQRGSYVYDTITDEKLIPPANVPARFFSEILYDIDRALVSKIGFNEEWRKEIN